MSVNKKSPSNHVELCNQAANLLGENSGHGGLWRLVSDCQGMVHELQVYQVEIDLMAEEAGLASQGLQAWRDESKRLQLDFKTASEKYSDVADSPEKYQAGLECVEATLKLYRERFRLMLKEIVARTAE